MDSETAVWFFRLDKDECQEKNGGCDHDCVNLIGGYTCKCRSGYMVDKNDKHKCVEGTNSLFFYKYMDVYTVCIINKIMNWVLTCPGSTPELKKAECEIDVNNFLEDSE